jgi:hypothetical protein
MSSPIRHFFLDVQMLHSCNYTGGSIMVALEFLFALLSNRFGI